MTSVRTSFIALAAITVAAVGCGGSTAAAAPYVVNPGTDLSLIPSMVDVERYARRCAA